MSLKQEVMFKTQPPVNGSCEAIIELRIPGRLPSWNEILGMQHWARDKFKCQLQDNFAYALRASANDSSIKTTSARSTMLTAAATLDSYRETVRERRRLRHSKKKQSLAQRNLYELKSLKKVPF